MRIGILADVHANEEALQAVLDDGQARVDQWWFLGDAVGRGPSPVETLLLLRQHVKTRHWLVGNHDLYVTGRLSSDGIATYERFVHTDHRERLQAYRPDGHRSQLWGWCLRTWRLKRARPKRIVTRKADVWFVHADLGGDRLNVGDIAGHSYIMPWSIAWDEAIARIQLRRLMAVQRESRPVVLIHGHTHVPYVAAKLRSRERLTLLPIRYGESQRLDIFEAFFINPGSVGQPRNGEKSAHADYGILDTEADTFQFRRVPYACTLTCRKMRALGYDEILIHILEGNHEHNALHKSNEVWMNWRKVYEKRPWGWEPV